MAKAGRTEGSITLVADMAGWPEGFEALALPHTAEAAVKEWELAVEVFFAATQQYAHVLSGDMLETGRYEVSRNGDQVVGELGYGGIRASSGKLVDYVKYELRRKGSHDFYGRAIRKTRGRLEEGTGKMIEAAFKEAFRG